MHRKSLFKFHRQHHDFRVTHASIAIACHPLEHLLVNLTALALPPAILGTPMTMTMLWYAVVSLNTSVTHCGYLFPWERWGLKSPGVFAHGAHHWYVTVEYGTLGLLDHVLKTNLAHRTRRR